ncbi:MAG: hypothetical protein HOE62_16975 [Alphaproteobacteria bacterium]|jgi:hypothetical protein|nr:hypothetical protein [Alphaproteobacteria bacterium]MBT4019649.1 hypothetical protein [Alphaproteobacteria bacterium]MBT4967082.1 hypothetical protein [Alphaproteobacteria bacterium]MBT5161800.1 hypothetical protein [Alphaproteobacteria bacterium]
MNTNQSNQTFLRQTLRANALFSVLSGLVLMIAAGPIASLMMAQPVKIFGFDMEMVLLAGGLAIFVFAVDVWLVSRPQHLNLLQAKLVLAMDVFWVVASIAILTVWPEVFTSTGLILVIGIAVIVAILGLLEFMGVFNAKGQVSGQTSLV